MKTGKPRVKAMTPGIPYAARVRAHVAAVVISLGLVGLVWRAWALQVEGQEHYRALAERQHASDVDIPAPRGEVLDRAGRPLAVSADADSIWANPRDIRDVTGTAEALAKLLGEDAASLEAKLATDRKFVWLDRHVKPEVAAAVSDAKLPGIYTAREPRRWYPGRTIAGPVIGRADIDGNGLDGIELSMNQYLTGTRGTGRAVRDARGRRMFADGMAQPQPGATVKLTLDRSVQAIADAALAEAMTTHQAKSGVVVVLDVQTSHVLAMASSPVYDPNHPVDVGNARNRPVTDAFEAGSVMKLFTIAAALDAGIVSPDTELDVQGPLMIGPKAIRDVHHDTYLTTTGIIKRSSNVGTVKIAMRLGRERLYEALTRFGFGARTEIELPGEQRGRVRPGHTWREIELATISFGYGLTVTPVQIAAALASIGNGGVYRAPRIVESITDADGKVIERPGVEPRQVISGKTAGQLRAMLATVFEGGKLGGTAASIVVPGFKCGGKTGTAHKYDPVTKRYAEKRYLSSFIGLAPIEDPRLAIVVIIDDPSGGDYYGGKVAGPVFAKVASESLRYLGVRGETLQCAPTPPGVNPLLVTAPKTCVIPAPKPVTGAKPVAEPAPEPAPAEEPAPPPDLLDPATAVLVPDLRGMGMRRALDTARELGIATDVEGAGRVVEQDPPPGLTAGPVQLRLRLSDGDSTIQPQSSSAP